MTVKSTKNGTSVAAEQRPDSAAGTEGLPGWSLAAIIVLSAMLVLGLRSVGWLEPLELAAYDQSVRWRSGGLAQKAEVAVIGFNDEDLARWEWPVRDAVLNTVINNALDAGALVVGVDIYRDKGVAPGSEDLNRTFRDNANIVAVMKYPSEQGEGVPAPPSVRDAHKDRVGFTDMVLDKDGFVRRGLLYLAGKGSVETSLSLQTARLKLKRRNVVPEAASLSDQSLKLGDAVIRPLTPNVGGFHGIDSAGYQFLLDFRRAPGEILFLSASDVFDKRIEADLLKDKIALIGVTSEQVKDHFILPVTGGAGQRATFGVVLHALVADQIVRLGAGVSRPTETAAGWLEILMMLAVAGVVALLVRRAMRPSAYIAVGIAGAVLSLAAGHAGLLMDVWLPSVPLTIVAGLTAFFALSWRALLDRRERVALAQILTTQVSPQVAQDLWQNRRTILQGLRPRPTRLIATVMFVDIAGSTAVADELAPHDLMTWISAFLEEMAEAVMKADGMVEKFTGDGLMAVFGAPVPRTGADEQARDAVNAVECALQMSRKVKELNARLDSTVFPQLRCRVGIHTGILSAGSVGTRSRMQFTVIGQTANLAARLEGYGKDDPKNALDGNGKELICRVLLSESTVELLPETYNIESMGELELRGSGAPMTVYRLLEEDRPIV